MVPAELSAHAVSHMTCPATSPSAGVKLVFVFFLLESAARAGWIDVVCLLSRSCSVVSVSMVNNTDVPDWTHQELRNTSMCRDGRRGNRELL